MPVKRLYLTHRPSELAAAGVLLECFAFSVWMVFTVDEWGWKLVFAHCAAFAAFVCWKWLFDMSGSDERRRAAESAEKG